VTARHARLDDDSPPSLRLVDADPDAGPMRDAFSPEVCAVLDAVASLHSAVISWAAATSAPDGPQRAGGRHRLT
jgi:hypothetical protein